MGVIASSVLSAVMGKAWSIRVKELAVYTTYLAVGGGEDGTIIENQRMVEKGRELIKSATGTL